MLRLAVSMIKEERLEGFVLPKKLVLKNTFDFFGV